jgi:cytochrome c oxidase subunit IV
MTQTTHGAPTAHEETVHGAGHEHPSDGKYVQIAIILAVITAAEVVTFYIEDTLGGALVPILLVMMVVKFFIVAAWFMHLRFDSRLFTRMFLAGLVLATAVYVAFLVSSQYFGDDTTTVDERRGDGPVQTES